MRHSNYNFSNYLASFLGLVFIILFSSNSVSANALIPSTGVGAIGESIINSTSNVPGLITGFAYLIGVVFTAFGLLKTKEHVDNPGNISVRFPIALFAAGGAMFALPAVYEAMATAINAGGDADFGPSTKTINQIGSIVGTAAELLPVQVIAGIMGNITNSVSTLPGFATAVAYILALLMGVGGILKMKEHVENPTNVPMKDGIVRLIVGGMLFASPSVFQSTYAAVNGSGSEGFDYASLLLMLAPNLGLTTESASFGCAVKFLETSLGGSICKLFVSSSPATAFLTAMAYLFGIFIAIWGIIKIKDHVEDPRSTPIFDPIAKLLVSGGLFALPLVVLAIYNSVSFGTAPHQNTIGGDVRMDEDAEGLDVMLGRLMEDTFVPVTVIVTFFGLVAGFIFIFIGITRLMKSAQEGVKGPGGIGTIMTFVTGGALVSFSSMISSLSASLFGTGGLKTQAIGTINYTPKDSEGGADTAISFARAEGVLDAIIIFVMLLGFISIMRGIFIVRGVSEGNSQASMMAGMTHLIGGALAVNMGPVLTIVQTTLGIGAGDLDGLGITFE